MKKLTLFLFFMLLFIPVIKAQNTILIPDSVQGNYNHYKTLGTQNDSLHINMPVKIMGIKSGVSMSDTTNLWIQKLMATSANQNTSNTHLSNIRGSDSTIAANVSTKALQQSIWTAVDSIISAQISQATANNQMLIRQSLDSLMLLQSNPYYYAHQDSVQKYLAVGDSILYDTTLAGKYAFTRCCIYDSVSTDSLQFQVVRNNIWTAFPMYNLNTGGIEVTMTPTPGQYTFYKPNGVYYFIKVRVIKMNKNAVGNIFCELKSQQ
jgi:hypothetical protein